MKTALLFLTCVAFSAAAIVCPEQRSGYIRDEQQCDKFYDCHKGNGEPFLCPDGLAFDDVQQKCDYEFNAYCLENSYFQPATNRSIQCPRDNGFFEHEDPTRCSKYYWCVEGKYTEGTCDSDNHFDELTGICAWPHLSHRTNCIKETFVHETGYVCDPTIQQFSNGNKLAHTLHPDPYDCKKFYTCLNGKVPQEASCPFDKLFNVDLLMCDDPLNIIDLELDCPDYVPVQTNTRV